MSSNISKLYSIFYGYCYIRVESPEGTEDIKLKIQYVFSSYDTEAITLQNAMETIADTNPRNEKIAFYTDSQSVCQQLKSACLKPKLVDESVNDMIRLLENSTNTMTQG